MRYIAIALFFLSVSHTALGFIPSDTTHQNNYYDFKKTKVIKKLGTFKVKSVDIRSIRFDKSEGNLTDANIFDKGDTIGFNIDKLYRCKSKGSGDYYFRMYWQDDFKEENGTGLYVRWYPSIPRFEETTVTIDIVEAPFIQKGTKSVCTIGDSQTWLFHGQEYRYYWSLLNPNLRFVGSRTDYYGFGHEGEGGDATGQILKRLSNIPTADIYVFLMGTNDRRAGISIEQTVQNIDSMITSLKKKKKSSSIYVLTTLPCIEADRDKENQQINVLLKKKYLSNNRNIKVLDTEALFRNKKNWTELFIDGLHPNDAGYKLLIGFLNEKIH